MSADEESVNLTPGVTWTEAQLAVVRDLLARALKAEAAVLRATDALEAMYRAKWSAWEELSPPGSGAPLSVRSQIAWVRLNQVLDCKEAVVAALTQPKP